MSSLCRTIYASDRKNNPISVLGLSFKNPIGLAAGFDKNAAYIDELACLGFSHIEIGTVTPKPQKGNEKPRLFRLKKDKAIINRMGFNNDGVEKVVERLKKRKSDIIVGGNIGKNKTTPNEHAVDDYTYCFERLFPYVDYFTINVSSPNTVGLRELQNKDQLDTILSSVQKINFSNETQKPVLLKIAPDLTYEQLDDVIEIVEKNKIDGIIATNTTIRRDMLQTESETVERIGAGGLSGKPLSSPSDDVLRYLSEKVSDDMVLVGVGGIFSSDDVKRKLSMAQLVQVYSGFVYQGPGFIKKLICGLPKGYALFTMLPLVILFLIRSLVDG